MVEPPDTFNPQLSDLEEKGRGIFFFHDQTTDLPVRDITGRGKMEPYIEYGSKNGGNEAYVVGAENYCYPCYQAAVQQLVGSAEKYLFLLTTPANRDLERQIVGYIRKDDIAYPEEDQVAVVGKTMLYSFDDAVPASELGKRTKAPLGKYGECFSKEETAEILNHFEGCDDVTEACLEKVHQLQTDQETVSQSNSGC